MKDFLKPIEEIKKNINTNLEFGLTQTEVAERLKKNGLNEFAKEKKRSFFFRLLLQFKDLMVLILILASALSFVVGQFLEGSVIAAIVLFNAFLGLLQEMKTEKALDAIKKLNQPHATVIRDGKIKQIEAASLVVGDVVVLKAGDIVPADIRLFECFSLKVDESSLTGETLPVLKNTSILIDPKTPLAERSNMCFSSTVVTYGRAVGIVTETAMETEIGKIASALKAAKSEETPLQKQISRLGKFLGLAAVLLCLVIFAVNITEAYIFSKTTVSAQKWLSLLILASTIAVAAIPEGLPAIITIILATGMQRLSRRGAILKTLTSVETLGATSVICSDKTGTLTKNKMTVKKLWLKEETYLAEELQLSNFNLSKLIEFAAVSNDSEIIDGSVVGDPTESCLVELAQNNGIDFIKLTQKYPRITELAFDSERKLMSTVHQIKDKKILIVKGAPEVLLKRCTNTADAKAANPAISTLANEAYRVLAVAFKETDISSPYTADEENNLTFLGLIAMQDPPREEVKVAIENAKLAGIQTIMITGDNVKTAKAIAKDLKIIESDLDLAITGVELDEMTDDEFFAQIKNIKVYARVSPENKVRIVETWQKHGKIISMTGDGVNDGPALKTAQIGVAMGKVGTEVAKSAADMILTDDNFATILKAVKEGRGIFSNIQKALHFLLASNIGELITIFVISLIGLFVFRQELEPFTSTQILWINVATDSFIGIAIAFEKTDKNVMKLKPRDPKAGFFKNGLGVLIFTQGVVLGLAATAAYLIAYHSIAPHVASSLNLDLSYYGKGFTLNQFKELFGSTAAFYTLCIAQFMFVYSTRNRLQPFYKQKTNWFLNIAVIICFVLQMSLIFIPGGKAFSLVNFRHITWRGFLTIFGFSAVLFVFSEITNLTLHFTKFYTKHQK